VSLQIRKFRRWGWWVAAVMSSGLLTIAITGSAPSHLSVRQMASVQRIPNKSTLPSRSATSTTTYAYPVNANGQTYGDMPRGATPSQAPDLIAVQGTGSQTGYVYNTQVNAAEIAVQTAPTPQAAQAIIAKYASPYTIPVYLSNGITVIGQFTVGESPTSFPTPKELGFHAS